MSISEEKLERLLNLSKAFNGNLPQPIISYGGDVTVYCAEGEKPRTCLVTEAEMAEFEEFKKQKKG